MAAAESSAGDGAKGCRNNQSEECSWVFPRRMMSTLHLSRTDCARIEGRAGRSAEQLVVTVLRCMTSWTEDGHAGIGARARSKSAPREHMMCWMRRVFRVVTSRLLCKDDLNSEGTV